MRGIMHVESAPASPEAVATYRAWYHAHLEEIAGIEGVVSARCYAPVGDDTAPMLAVYDLEGDDILEVAARIRAGSATRTPQPSGVFRTDPPTAVRFYRLVDQAGA